MNLKKGILGALILTSLTASAAFSYEIIEVGFPYKGLVYDGVGITADEKVNVEEKSDDYFYYAFVYDGVYYTCELLIYGAIILKAYESESAEEDDYTGAWLLCFNVSDSRMPTMSL